MHDALRKKIAAEIQRQGREMKEVSLSAGLGETYVRDFLKRGRGKLENLVSVANALGFNQLWLMSEDSPPAANRTDRTPASDAFAPVVLPGRELVGARDFPIYAAAQGGAGFDIVTFEAVEVVKRPSILEGVRDAYGLLIDGDSMWPEYRHGDMALVHPGLPKEREQVHVFYDHTPDGQAQAIIKNLRGWTETQWQLQQYNPQKEWTEFRVDWPIAHLVVGKYARRR